jgi:exodeoxyribonuclease V alpha subunit
MNKEQKKAVYNAMHYKISCITGPPGSGKSYCISEIARQLDSKLVILSLTGKCSLLAKSLSDTALCLTIAHFMIVYDKKPINLIIDEASMVSVQQFADLIAIAKCEKIILIGDTNQLPPINASRTAPSVFDIIMSKCPTVHLTRTYRFTNQDSALVHNIQNFFTIR